MKRTGFILCLILSSWAAWAVDPFPEGWESAVTTAPAGDFPLPPDADLRYRFGWSGIKAGEASAELRSTGDRLLLSGHGRSLGPARVLWSYNAAFRNVVMSAHLRPRSMILTERARDTDIETRLRFRGDEVFCYRASGDVEEQKTFRQPHLQDLLSVLLYVRSLDFDQHPKLVIPVFAISSPYLAIVELEGEERLRVAGGRFPAYRFNLQLYRINDRRELEEHRRFRSGRIWMSADEQRLPLRVEVEIFIGRIFAELEAFEPVDDPE